MISTDISISEGLEAQKKPRPKQKNSKPVARATSSEIPSGTDITMLKAGSDDESKDII